MIWSEVETMRADLAEACETVRGMTGTRCELIDTGGNCGALEARLEGSCYLLVTDGDVFTADGGMRQEFVGGWTVGLYSDDEHIDCLGFGYGPVGDPGMWALRQAVLMALDPSTRER